jgi:hypothetical protein
MDGAASLAPGTGRLDLLGYATLERMGAAVEYEQRLRHPGLATFARAWAGATHADEWKPDAGVMGGLTFRW